MKKRVGIITMYYQSKNYGGILQSYALLHVINKLGYHAELISYDWTQDKPIKLVDADNKMSFLIKTKYCIYKYLRKLYHSLEKGIKFKKTCLLEADAFHKEVLSILPHTDSYNSGTIHKTLENFDVFITGSDQVWNPSLGIYMPYFLNFVPSSKKTISYAPSVAKDSLSQSEMKFLKESIAHYNAVSIREENLLQVFKESLGRSDAVVMPDPTLLLAKEEWDSISSEQIIYKPYVFAYFLGKNLEQRELAKEYARKKGLLFVSIPLTISGKKTYKWVERNSDVNLPFASIGDFISLIKHSEAVFTDSFHGIIFSSIFSKPLVILDRFKQGSNDSMNSRIDTITKELNLMKHRIADYNLDVVENIIKLHNDSYEKEIPELRKRGIDYLINNIG